ncbi:lipopolysaccharide biosynthesis protein [Thalassotalea euphylliae]|uniref:lipopolysaccharide biosynthesis protein n=1 Tax=Thalassotalea euphylliae TaxID=1655234 RepID=UPI003625BA85
MFRRIVQTLGSTIGIFCISFLTSVLTARYLGADGRGILASWLLIATVSAGLSQCGFHQSSIYFSRKLSKNKALPFFNFSLFIVVTLTAITGAVIHTFIELSAVILPLICFSVVYSLFFFLSNILQIEKDLKKFNIVKLVYPLVILIGVLLAVFSENINLQVALFSYGFSASLCAFVMLVYFIKRYKWTTPTLTLKRYCAFSAKYHGTAALGILVNNIDKLLLISLIPAAMFGNYSVAFATSRVIGTGINAISTVLFSQFAGEASEKVDPFTRSFRLAFPIFLLPTAALSLSAFFWVPLVFGEDFQPAALLFSILVFEAFLSGMGWILAQRFNSEGKPGIVLLRQIISVLPIGLIFFVPSGYDIAITMAYLMLISAIVRLILTAWLYRLSFSEVDIIPRSSEFKELLSHLNSKVKNVVR